MSKGRGGMAFDNTAHTEGREKEIKEDKKV
jgi:hypothetical protein